jgi:hypothetical protein
VVEIGVVLFHLALQSLDRQLDFALHLVHEVDVDEDVVVLVVEPVLDAHDLQDLRMLAVEFLQHG